MNRRFQALGRVVYDCQQELLDCRVLIAVRRLAVCFDLSSDDTHVSLEAPWRQINACVDTTPACEQTGLAGGLDQRQDGSPDVRGQFRPGPPLRGQAGVAGSMTRKRHGQRSKPFG